MAFTFVEEWDRAKLEELLSRVREASSRHAICTLLQQLDGQFNTVEYSQTYAGGRYYGSFPCAQSFNGKLRRAYFYGLAVDIDIKNCFPSILEQVCVRCGIECPQLTTYNIDPKKFQIELADAVGDETLQAKTYFICMLHGGDLRLSELDEDLSNCYLNAEDAYPFVRALRLEFEYIYRELRSHYPEIALYAAQLAERASSRNVQGRFFHLMLCVHENNCLMAMKEHAIREHRQIVGYWYDGFMLWHDDEDEEKNPLDLHAYEDAVLTSTGFSITLAVKSLEPTQSDRDWLDRSDFKLNEEMVANRTYNTSIRVQPFLDFGTGANEWLLISAPMGSGKTHQMVLYILRLFAKNPLTRILIPTSRIIQSVMYRSLLSKQVVNGRPLPVTVYRDSDFLQKAQYGAAVVVCEYESLHLLLKPSDSNPIGECMGFTSVILDEMGGLMSTLISPTNGFNLVQNYTTFKFITTSAKTVLCMCADMFYTRVVPEFVLGLVDQNSVRAIIYTTPTVSRTYIIYPDNVSLVDWQSLLWSSIRSTLEDDAAPRTALLTRTKIAVDSFLKQLTDVFEDVPGISDRFVVVTRDTSHTDMEKWKDMDSVFQGKLGFVASPKITSATDIQTEHRVFMDIRGIDGASVRSIGQASGRVRVANEETIHVLQPYYKPSPLPPEPTQEECMAIVIRREASRIHTMAAFKQEIESHTRIIPGFEEFGVMRTFSIREPTDPNLVKLVANITQESKLSSRTFFVQQWHAWILLKGFKLVFADRDTDGPSDEQLQLHKEAKLALKVARAAVKDAHLELEARVLAELRCECTSLGDIDRALSQMKTIQAQESGLNNEQSVRLMMLSAMSKYPSYFGDLTLEQIQYTMKHSSVLYAATVCNMLSPAQIRDLDVSNASKAPLLADAGLIGQTVELATELLRLGGGTGFVHSDEFDIDIDAYLLPSNIPKFKALTGKIKDSLKSISSSALRKSRATAENRAMVKGELRSILARIGVKLEGERPRHCTKFRVVPHDSVKDLLPHLSFRSLDPDADSGSETLRELMQRERAYTRLLDAVQHSCMSTKRAIVLTGHTKKKKRRIM